MADGIINVLKPPNMTSHDVVSFIRKTYQMKKVGHTGTLDPYAAGVLPVCLGKATRVAEYFNDSKITKIYRAELSLGSRTDTQDAYGEIIEKKKIKRVSDSDILEAFRKFTGTLLQTPPMYSAKKVNGKKLYELARAGIEVERKSREVNIYSLDLIKNDGELFIFDVECSSGTYVRTLCEDIAASLGNIGYMSFLLRKKVGAYDLENSFTLEEIESAFKNSKNELLLSLETALTHYDKIELDEKYFDRILNGVKIKVEDKYEPEKKYRIYCNDSFIGIGRAERETGLLKMEKVLFQRG